MVDNLEDIWRVSKLQRERKAAEQAKKKAHLARMRVRRRNLSQLSVPTARMVNLQFDLKPTPILALTLQGSSTCYLTDQPSIHLAPGAMMPSCAHRQVLKCRSATNNMISLGTRSCLPELIQLPAGRFADAVLSTVALFETLNLLACRGHCGTHWASRSRPQCRFPSRRLRSRTWR